MDYSKLTNSEIDALAAECMGWHFGERTMRDTPNSLPAWRDVNEDLGAYDWHPSRVPSDAFRLMEHVLADGLLVTTQRGDAFCVTIRRMEPCLIHNGQAEERWVGNATAPTLTRAITEAIVKAVAK